MQHATPTHEAASPAEREAAFTAVRALVDARAGWYAGMISDAMLRDVVQAALAAAAKVRAAPASARAAKP